jgi:succinate-semialdehyde dehydrogenase/glutarate-semialdehyde dehydrogenase
MMYPKVQLHINGRWVDGAKGRDLTVLNPATGDTVGSVAAADTDGLDAALDAAQQGFEAWRRVSPFERGKLMRRAAELLRARADTIAPLLTLEQGKPLAEARAEILSSADLIDWFAEEARRAYGRVVPARTEGVYQLVVREPVGPVAAFTPWNFPISQAVRKISAALAAGCSVVIKGPEEAPASCAALVAAFTDTGLPAGALNLVFGVPAEISAYLIPHPVIRKVSFTGSTAVGKQLAALAGQHMKRVTMELGGHAPAIVFDDADVAGAAKLLAAVKFRNAGQVCASPTRFLVQQQAYGRFLEDFTAAAAAIKVGDGLAEGTQMGPLANPRRVEALEGLVQDAVERGATLHLGGKRIGNTGNFFAPTILTGTPTNARVMNEEPFGPLAVIQPFGRIEDAVTEANRLPYGLAAFAFTGSARTAQHVAAEVETGMMSINHFGLALPEVPFGGVKDSGYGSEGGSEAMDAYLNSKFVSQAGI